MHSILQEKVRLISTNQKSSNLFLPMVKLLDQNLKLCICTLKTYERLRYVKCSYKEYLIEKLLLTTPYQISDVGRSEAGGAIPTSQLPPLA